MQTMQDADVLAEPPVVFAHNELAFVVPPDNPAEVEGLEDLQDADYVVCAEAAPCGALAAELLDGAGITHPPRSYEVDVKAVLTKVQLGEADAGLVYASDVVAAGDRIHEVPLPAGDESATSYPIAVTADSEHPDLAEAWVDLVRSGEGQQVLSRAGFSTDADASP
jgi:molybdate transport system substrate-binding protein